MLFPMITVETANPLSSIICLYSPFVPVRENRKNKNHKKGGQGQGCESFSLMECGSIEWFHLLTTNWNQAQDNPQQETSGRD